MENQTHHPFLQLDVLSIHQNNRSFEDCGEENRWCYYCYGFMICTYLLLLNSRERHTHLLTAPHFKMVKMLCKEHIFSLYIDMSHTY